MKRTVKKQQVLRLPPHKQRKLKKIKREAMFAEEGRILGQFKAHKKKPLIESVKEHLGKLIDNIHIDPMEAMAILGATVLVKKAMDEIPDVTQKFMEKYPTFPLFGIAGGLLYAVAPSGIAPLKPQEIDKH